MADVFISHSESDSQLAAWLYQSCENFNISAFLAPISLRAGSEWKQEILNKLRQAKWFFFLATANSIKSDAVKHEIGGALILNKNIIPILYGIDYKDLPEWINNYQGIRVSHNSAAELKSVLEKVSERIKTDKVITSVIVGILIGALFWADKG